MSDEGYLPARYVIRFSYTVDGRAYEGSYRANSERDCGDRLEIVYDPREPRRNSGSDIMHNPWVKWGARIAGVAIVIGAIWLWRDQSWLWS